MLTILEHPNNRGCMDGTPFPLPLPSLSPRGYPNRHDLYRTRGIDGLYEEAPVRNRATFVVVRSVAAVTSLLSNMSSSVTNCEADDGAYTRGGGGSCSACGSLSYSQEWLVAFNVFLCHECKRHEHLISKVIVGVACCPRRTGLQAVYNTYVACREQQRSSMLYQTEILRIWGVSQEQILIGRTGAKCGFILNRRC